MNLKKLFAAFLAVTLLLGTAGCNNSTSNTADTSNAAKEPAANLATNTLHKVSITETSRLFAAGGTTEYVLAVGEGELNLKAAGFISSHVAQATGASLPVVDASEVPWSAQGKCIYFNCPEQFAQAGLTMPSDDLGNRGYYIKTAGNSVFISTNADVGAQMAAIAFLRYVIGYDMIASDMTVYNKKGDTLPDMEIIERPDYEFYVASNKMDSTTRYGMGFVELLDVFINITSKASSYGPFHNSLDYLPYDEWYDIHPDWYSDVTFNDGTGIRRELCYTAHGNEEELEEMITMIADRMILEARNNPNNPAVCITIEDHTTICSCSACTASYQKYNGSNAAAVIQMLNRVNEKVQAALQADADAAGTEKRSLDILFFAYHKMLKAPAVKNADGEWEPVDESVITAPEVGVFYAPIEAYFTYPFEHANNEEHDENTQSWAACTDKFYMWLYDTNFGFYMYPYNSFDTMINNYRYFQDVGALFMFNQGQHNQNSATAFADFKDYLNSRALFDVNVELSDVMDTYFSAYFREAAEPMLNYYNELQAHLYYLADAYPIQLNGYIREEIDSPQYWPRNMLIQWLGYLDEAYAVIEKYKDTDSELYDVLYSHILQESIFPRFVMLDLHPNYYQADELLNLRKQFKADCTTLGITKLSEHVEISTVFSLWGIA